jgi:uncharacterized protein (TIGR02145 family)
MCEESFKITYGMKSTGIIISTFLSMSMLSCKPAEIILHGDIAGIVTDNETSQPLQSAMVTLINTDDTTRTVSDGTFVLRNIIPGKYEIQTTKTGYDLSTKNVTVGSAETQQVDFPLKGIPVPHFSSTCVDFGLDSTNLALTLSNLGKGVFTYVITKNQPWINVSPSSGDVSNEPEKIRITINRNDLSENIYNGLLEITSSGPGVLIKDTIHVNLNGVADQACNYYKIVKIGSQIWMAENLNIGNRLDIHVDPADNGYVEKWCVDCKTYGGLYTWSEAMNYQASDTGMTSNIQGICPTGWHIPNKRDVVALLNFVSDPVPGESGGEKLKAISPLWKFPNEGATNETGFSALPGGYVKMQEYVIGYYNLDPNYNSIDGVGTEAEFWESDFTKDFVYANANPHPIDVGGIFRVDYSSKGLYVESSPVKSGLSVRCIKDQ